jgi:hypothetical protein
VRVITTSITITAEPQVVWDVLVDFDRYAEWNPFIVRAEGRAVEGTSLQIDVQPPGGRVMTHHPAVVRIEPARRLEWLGRLSIPGMFAGRHEFVLEPGSGRTLLHHHEEFTGLLVPLLGSTLRRTEAGFHALNAALKKRAEEQPAPDKRN